MYIVLLVQHVTQMLRQCIDPNQKDWVAKLPAIQFAINSTRSESTGYTPFFLNNGRMLQTMIWNTASSNEYLNVVKCKKTELHEILMISRIGLQISNDLVGTLASAYVLCYPALSCPNFGGLK